FGIARPIDTVKLYILDDGKTVVPPSSIELQYWDGQAWHDVPGQTRSPQTPTGRRANTITFPTIRAEKIRAMLTHAENGRSGLSEFEAWGDGELPITPAPAPKGNLALNESGQGFPKASASFTSRFDKVEEAIDGKIVFAPEPRNRWTTYESPNKSDWLAIDFGAEKSVARVSLHIYDDRGGVQAPAAYTVEHWDGQAWRDCDRQVKTPRRPAGGRVNEVSFTPVKTNKIRVVLTHKGNSRSGVTEIEAWGE
ncbi:MAG TPA: discoidin domain-containing protein, partial [Tepidisphaeraceae bacterium]